MAHFRMMYIIGLMYECVHHCNVAACHCGAHLNYFMYLQANLCISSHRSITFGPTLSEHIIIY